MYKQDSPDVAQWNFLKVTFHVTQPSLEFFTVNTKLTEMAILSSKDLFITGSGDYWIKNLMHQTKLNWNVLVSLRLLDLYIVMLF